MLQKTILTTILIGGVAGVSYAQGARSQGLRNELSVEVEQLYKDSGGQEEEAQVSVAALPKKQITSPQVVVVSPNNTNTVAPSSYVEQRPKAYVDSSPLDESNAAKLRRKRQSVEVETEMRIVEKLEQDRMESEKKRAARLFGDKWDQGYQAAAPVQQPVAPQPQAQVYMVSPAEQELEKEDLKQDLREIVSELKSEEKEVVSDDDFLGFGSSSMYVGVGGGAGMYPDTKNIDGGYRLSLNLGWDYTSGMSVDLGLGFSEYDLYDCFNSNYSCSVSPYGGNLKTIKQTDISLLINYKFNNRSRFTPTLGGVTSIVLRDYSSNSYNSSNELKSRALDLGISGGMLLELSPNMQLAADARYMFNVVKDVDANGYSPFTYYASSNATDVEELQYLLINVGVRLLF